MSRSESIRQAVNQQPVMFLASAVVFWFLLYQTLIPFSETLVSLLPVERDSRLGSVVA